MFNCQTCGICCKAKIIQIRFGIQSNKNHCSELIGEIGKNVSCGIYNNRPQTCKDFESGSERCRELRIKNGMF